MFFHAMDLSWSNYGINGYSQFVPFGDGNSSLNLVNSSWIFKPRAYVNPKLVSCVYPFAKVNNGPVSKTIHINPNFKCAYYQTNSTQAKSETSAPHVNPNFCSVMTDVNDGSRQGFEDLPLNSSFKVEESSKKSTCVPEKRVQEDLAEKQFPTCSTSGKFNSSTSLCNSTYFWSKQNAKPFENVLVPPKEFGTQNYEKADTTKCVPLHLSNIKTRHKIIHGISSSSRDCPPVPLPKGNTIMNCKTHYQNPYKIVNVEKSKFRSSQSKIYHTVKKRNLGVYSKTNVVNTDVKECASDPKKFHATAKMKVSNIHQTAHVNKIRNLIRTKYMHLNKRKQLKILRIGHYKLDKRKKNLILKRNTSVEDVHNGHVSFYKSRFALKNKTWKSMLCKVNKPKPVNVLVWRKEQSLDKDLQRIGKSYPNKTVVNIGGIMYKSTINKLTRTKDKKQSSHQFNLKPMLKSCKINQVVHVRGEKFLLGEGGKTLIRQFSSDETDCSNKCSVRRVDIGGVTYIQKSRNVLIQTKTHQARNFVNYAKQKSIALLSNLHKRNNRPCMIYQKFGICRRHARGMCIYVHDPKNVALCKKFLKGDCNGSDCLLSHDIVKEKVATCHFFLKGNCQRENCPFLHVKVNKKAAICVDFLDGFCALGQNCKKRHVHQCPDFDGSESCNRGSKCPYPHRKMTERKMKEGTTYEVSKFKLTENRVKKAEDKKIEGKTKGKKMKTKKRKTKTDKCSLQESCNDSTIECIPKRVKLDNLPFFIPLNP